MQRKYLLFLLFASIWTTVSIGTTAQQVVEIRSYTLQPGTRDAFHQLVIDKSLPMLQRWNIPVLGYGPSLQEDSSYYLVRTYPSLEKRQQTEDAFYGSTEWKQGPRESIMSKIRYYTTIVLPADTLRDWLDRLDPLTGHKTDSLALSRLNHQFIENFIRQDTLNHTTIIDPDFVCIESDGTIVPRVTYMKDWASAYAHSGYTSFRYTDERIRIFGTTALVRSKTVYTKSVNGTTINGNSIYTDTYRKRNGNWYCVQAQTTPVR
jgi:hypothetical protein